MSTNVTFNGVQYSVPAYGDIGYAQGAGNLSAYLIAIASGALQQTGGNFTLTADANFGPTYGLLAAYYKSRTANPAQSGIVRLANNSDAVSWRNAANSADLALKVNALNHLEFNGVEIESNTLTSGHIFVGNASNESTDTAMTGDVSITNAGVTAIANAVVTGKLITGYVSGAAMVLATDSILQAINKLNGNDLLKLPLAGGSLSGDLTMTGNKAVIFNDNQGSPAQVTLKAPATVSASYTLKFPTTAGTNTYVLATDGSGNLSWVPNGTGVVGTGAQYEIPYYATAGTTLTNAPNIHYNATGDLEILTGHKIKMDGSASGAVSLVPPATVTSYDLTVPPDGGTNGQFLQTNGSGTTVWANASTIASYREDYVVGTALNNYTGSLTVFNLVNAYNVASHTLVVTLDGDVQTIGASVDYLETNSTTVTFNNSLVTGQKVSFIFQVASSSGGIVNSGTANQVTYYAANGTTVSGTNAITVGANGPNAILVGTNTNDNAAAGKVGEYVESVASATNVPTSNTFGDLTSISLTAGDWDVSVMGTGFVSATTTTYFQIGLSTTSGNSGTGLVDGDTRAYAGSSVAFSATALPSMAVTPKRFSLSSTTTIYFKYLAIYSSGTPQVAGRISARRIR